MSVIEQIKQIVEQRVQRVLHTVYGSYCPQKMLASFCVDVQYHLWSDIPNQLTMIIMTPSSFLDIDVSYIVDQIINGVQEPIVTLVINVEADVYRMTYRCTIPTTPQKLNNDDITLNNATW